MFVGKWQLPVPQLVKTTTLLCSVHSAYSYKLHVLLFSLHLL